MRGHPLRTGVSLGPLQLNTPKQTLDLGVASLVSSDLLTSEGGSEQMRPSEIGSESPPGRVRGPVFSEKLGREPRGAGKQPFLAAARGRVVLGGPRVGAGSLALGPGTLCP